MRDKFSEELTDRKDDKISYEDALKTIGKWDINVL